MRPSNYTIEQRHRAWYARPWFWLAETDKGNLALLLVILATMSAGLVVFNLAVGSDVMRTVIKGIQPLVVCVIVMWFQLGSPLNWWRPFFGTTMTVNIERIVARERASENSDDIQVEIQRWVEGIAKGRWSKINGFTYKFLRKGDAMFFKLAWG